MAHSHFYDSPLSDLGRDQCEDLAKFVATSVFPDDGQLPAWKVAPCTCVDLLMLVPSAFPLQLLFAAARGMQQTFEATQELDL